MTTNNTNTNNSNLETIKKEIRIVDRVLNMNQNNIHEDELEPSPKKYYIDSCQQVLKKAHEIKSVSLLMALMLQSPEVVGWDGQDYLVVSETIHRLGDPELEQFIEKNMEKVKGLLEVKGGINIKIHYSDGESEDVYL